MKGPFISNPHDSSQTLFKIFNMHNPKPDLVVLELTTPFSRSAVVAPACLPKQQINTESSSCYASGWGEQEQTYGQHTPINPLNYTLPKIIKYSI